MLTDQPLSDTAARREKRAATVALWTPSGRGAVATIKVRGDFLSILNSAAQPPFRAANGRPLGDQPLNRVVFGYWGSGPVEEVVVCLTSDRELEIHCHGGHAAASRIVRDWEALDVPTVDWTDQSRERSGDFATDCQLAISQATTLRTAGILLDQQDAWSDFAVQSVQLAHAKQWDTLRDAVTSALEWWELGRHLIEPFQVVLTGRPNVGKSALLNALVGFQRSVVYDQPGTTRDVVTAEAAFDGWPVRLIDTAGLRDEATGLEQDGIRLAHAQIAQADLILHVSDVTTTSEPDLFLPSNPDTPTLFVANKIDLLTDPVWSLPAGAVAVSATTNAGIDQLVATIAKRLVPRTPGKSALIPFREVHNRWLQQMATDTGNQSTEGIEHFAARIISQ